VYLDSGEQMRKIAGLSVVEVLGVTLRSLVKLCLWMGGSRIRALVQAGAWGNGSNIDVYRLVGRS
jgi:hypothetical protein